MKVVIVKPSKFVGAILKKAFKINWILFWQKKRLKEDLEDVKTSSRRVDKLIDTSADFEKEGKSFELNLVDVWGYGRDWVRKKQIKSLENKCFQGFRIFERINLYILLLLYFVSRECFFILYLRLTDFFDSLRGCENILFFVLKEKDKNIIKYNFKKRQVNYGQGTWKISGILFSEAS